MIITRADLISRIQQVPRGESTRAHAHADASSGETSARSAACHIKRPRVEFPALSHARLQPNELPDRLLAHASRAGCISDMPDDHAPSIVGTLLVRVLGRGQHPACEEAMAQAIQRTRPIFRTWTTCAARPDFQRVRFARSTGVHRQPNASIPGCARFRARKRCVFAPRERNDTFANCATNAS
jgi:hypothetical protein